MLGDVLSRHWFIDLCSLRNRGGVDRTWSPVGAISVCQVTGAMGIGELAWEKEWSERREGPGPSGQRNGEATAWGGRRSEKSPEH